MIDLDELERLRANGTHGKWATHSDGTKIEAVDADGGTTHVACVCSPGGAAWEDATHICAMHNSQPALLAELRSLRTRLAASEAGAAGMREALQMVNAEWIANANGVDAYAEQIERALSPDTGRTALAVIEAAEAFARGWSEERMRCGCTKCVEVVDAVDAHRKAVGR